MPRSMQIPDNSSRDIRGNSAKILLPKSLITSCRQTCVALLCRLPPLLAGNPNRQRRIHFRVIYISPRFCKKCRNLHSPGCSVVPTAQLSCSPPSLWRSILTAPLSLPEPAEASSPSAAGPTFSLGSVPQLCLFLWILYTNQNTLLFHSWP